MTKIYDTMLYTWLYTWNCIDHYIDYRKNVKWLKTNEASK